MQNKLLQIKPQPGGYDYDRNSESKRVKIGRQRPIGILLVMNNK